MTEDNADSKLKPVDEADVDDELDGKFMLPPVQDAMWELRHI